MPGLVTGQGSVFVNDTFTSSGLAGVFNNEPNPVALTGSMSLAPAFGGKLGFTLALTGNLPVAPAIAASGLSLNISLTGSFSLAPVFNGVLTTSSPPIELAGGMVVSVEFEGAPELCPASFYGRSTYGNGLYSRGCPVSHDMAGSLHPRIIFAGSLSVGPRWGTAECPPPDWQASTCAPLSWTPKEPDPIHWEEAEVCDA